MRGSNLSMLYAKRLWSRAVLKPGVCAVTRVNGSNSGRFAVQFVVDATTNLCCCSGKRGLGSRETCREEESETCCLLPESGDLARCRQQQRRRFRSQPEHMGQRSSHFFLRSRPISSHISRDQLDSGPRTWLYRCVLTCQTACSGAKPTATT